MKTALKTMFIILLVWSAFTAETIGIDYLFLEALGLIILGLWILNFEDVDRWLKGNAL